MSDFAALLFLTVAAFLESGGDALVRRGMPPQDPLSRIAYLGLGAATLFAYGLFVNTPSWDFGRLLGVYVALFFVAAQTINFVFFDVVPTVPVAAGGALIIAGGLLMTFWK